MAAPIRTLLLAGIAAGVVVVGVGCGSADERKLSPAEWLEENSSILRDLKSYDTERRKKAIARFKEIDRERGTAVILSILTDPNFEDYRVEVVLARLLADYRDPRAVQYLLKFLSHPDDGAVKIAAEGVAVFPEDRRVREALLEMIRLGAVREKVTAAEVLADLHRPELVEAAAQIYDAGEPQAVVRGALLRVILDGRHPRRTEFLIRVLADADQALREIAWNAVREDPEIPNVGYDPAASDRDRAIAVGELRTWMRQKG